MILSAFQIKQIIKEEIEFFLDEDRRGNKIIGYHATNTGVNLSNVLGWKEITTNRSVDMASAQGGGFYLFSDKNRALRRLKSTAAVSDWDEETGIHSYRKMDPDLDGLGMIITLEVPYSFRHLEIDYEVSYDIWIDFVITYMDRFLSLTLPNGQKIFDYYDKENNRIVVKPPYNVKRQLGPYITLDKKISGGTKRLVGNVMSRVFKFMEQGLFGSAAKGIHQEFEEQLIEKAPAFKYNGKNISPTKIEIVVNDRLYDVTKEVLSGDFERMKAKLEI